MVNGWKITAIVFMIFLVGFGLVFINADAILKEKIYDPDLKKVTIRDRITKNIRAEITLTKNSNICGEFCYAEGEILLEDNEKIIDSLRFKKRDYKDNWDYEEINDYTLYINKSSKLVDVEEQVWVCDELNKTCGYEVEIHQEEVVTWEEYDDKSREPGLYKWRIEGYKDPFVTVDWLATFAGTGIEIDDWAIWGGVGSPVGYWDYNNYFSNGSVVIDSIHNGTALNGTISSMTAAEWVNGILNEAVAFKISTGNYNQFAYNNTMNLAGVVDYSYSVWVNITYLPGWQNVILDAPNSDASGYRIFINFSSPANVTCLNHTATADTNEYVCGLTNIQLGNWTHIVVTYDASAHNATIYVDGAADNSSYVGNMVNWTSGNSYHGLDLANKWEGIIDEVGLWKRPLTGLEVLTLFNNRTGLRYGDELITLDTPLNDSSVGTNAELNCTANSIGSTWVNISLWTSLEGWHRNATNVVTGTRNSTNFTEAYPDGTYTWNCEACATDYSCYNATSNYTFNVDTVAPNIDYISHNVTQNYTRVGGIEDFYWNVTDLIGLFGCGYNYNGTNATIADCSANYTTFEFEEGNYDLTFYINDSAGNENVTHINWTYKIFENATEYNSTSYISNIEGIKINITSDGTQTVTANIIYNGTSFSTTKSGDNDFMTFSSDVSIPLVTGNKSFFWNVSYGGDIYSTDENNMTISGLLLGLCNESLTGEYLNFTFRDETNSSEMNALNDETSFTYWIQDSDINQTYSFSNATLNWNYSFCFDPNDTTMNVDLVFKYSKTGYPLRTFSYDDQALTNVSTSQTLYLLPTASGIYSSISIIETSGATIGGVLVVIEREIGGAWTVVGQAVTGSDGLVTFWVNPNFAHRVTATKTGYTATTVTITPSQSLYTLTLGATTGNASYTSEIPGLKWILYPGPGVLTNGTHNFNVTITSTRSNLEDCKLELLNASNTSQVLTSATDSTNSTYCYVNFDYTAVVNENIFGRLSVDTTETDGFIVVDTDWLWILIDIQINAWRTITSFFEDIQNISEFGEGNEGEFGRIVLFFIITTILISAFTFFSGVELSSPGMSLIIIWGVIFFASVGGFLTIGSASPNISGFFKQFAFVFMFTLFVGSYLFNIMRRENE